MDQILRKKIASQMFLSLTCIKASQNGPIEPGIGSYVKYVFSPIRNVQLSSFPHFDIEKREKRTTQKIAYGAKRKHVLHFHQRVLKMVKFISSAISGMFFAHDETLFSEIRNICFDMLFLSTACPHQNQI